jgi:mycothiol synthase
MPAVAPLSWRSLTLADVPAMTVLLAEIEAADHWGYHFDESFLARWLEDPMIDLDRGTTATFDGGRMVAMGVLASRPEADPVHSMRYEGGVHPAYRGRGLGSELVDWIGRAAGPLHQERYPGRPAEVGTRFPESDTTAVALFARHGFAPARHNNRMVRDLAGDDLPPLRVPDGYEIVPYRADLDEQMRVAKNEAFSEHWGVTPTPPEIWRTQFTGPEFRPDLSPLALDAATGQVIGLIVTHLREAETAATGHRDAHLDDVATLRQARGRGIASALIATMLRTARDAGFATASLYVDTENPTGARQVYEKSGFRVADTWTVYTRAVPVA